MNKKTIIAALAVAGLLLSQIGLLFIYAAQANPIVSIYNDIQPPKGTQAPIVTIYTPNNRSSYQDNITLTYQVTKPVTTDNGFLCRVARIYYTCNWKTDKVILKEGSWGSGSINLTDAPSGNLSITIYAEGYGCKQTGEEYKVNSSLVWTYNYFDRFWISGYSMVNFVKDPAPTPTQASTIEPTVEPPLEPTLTPTPTINGNQTLDSTPILALSVVVVIAVAVGALIYFKRREGSL